MLELECEFFLQIIRTDRGGVLFFHPPIDSQTYPLQQLLSGFCVHVCSANTIKVERYVLHSRRSTIAVKTGCFFPRSWNLKRLNLKSILTSCFSGRGKHDLFEIYMRSPAEWLRLLEKLFGIDHQLKIANFVKTWKCRFWVDGWCCGCCWWWCPWKWWRWQ